MIWLGVAATSAAGAIGRFTLTAGLERAFNRTVPWGTAVVNLTGAFLLGLLVGSGPSDDAVRLLGAGFLGSFSTYSTWMVEGVFLAGTGSPSELFRAALWVLGLLAAGVAAYGLGLSLAR